MRLRSALLAAPLLAALACADDPPAAPATPDVDPNAHLIGRDGCQAPAVVILIATTFPRAERGPAERDFIRARLIDLFGDNERAWLTYVRLAADALAYEQAGTLRDPPGAFTAEDAAVRLVDLLYRCGGRPPVGDALDDVVDDGAQDVVIAPVLPTEPSKIVVPSANFGLDAPAGFFDEPAIVVIQRVPDDSPLPDETRAQYPPRYRVTVLPEGAQVNFGRAPGETDPTVLVIVCPGNPHPDLDDLAILRIPDGFPTDPAQLLDSEHVHDPDVTCSEAGAYVGGVGAREGMGARLLAGLQRAGSAAFGWLAPRPLYAVDGGIGGRTRLMSEFVAVSSPSEEPSPGEDVVVVNDINVLDAVALLDPNNQQFARNLVSYETTRPRGAGTTVLYDRTHGSKCFAEGFCDDADLAALDGVLAGAGYTVARENAALDYAALPADVKVIVMFNPMTAFTPAEVEGIRSFARDGGRVVYLGEHIGYYTAQGLATENALLAALGAQLTNEGATIDCLSNQVYPTLGAASLRPHQTTTGLTGLTVACMSRIIPGEGDYAFLYDASNTVVVGGAAKIALTPEVIAQRRARSDVAPLARRGAAASVVARATHDPAGRPLPPR